MGDGAHLVSARTGPARPHDAYLWVVEGNDRARRFYARHGFTLEEGDYRCGTLWYQRVVHRMVRRQLPG